MRIDPALRALRSDPTPQRIAQQRVQSAKQDWRTDPLVASVADDLAKFGGGADLGDCLELAALFSDDGTGADYVSLLIDYFLPALANEPLGQMPFRHDYRDGQSTLILAKEGVAMLSLHLSTEQKAKVGERTGSVRFSGGERHEVIIAGSAKVCLVERKARDLTPASLTEREFHIGTGDVLSLDGDLQATIVGEIDGRLMRLRLTRTSTDPAPSQQYLRNSGELIHQAAGKQSESRQELMMALLGRMKRADAGPVMADMAREGSAHLRWQGLRESLALDTARGFSVLCQIAAKPGDPLAGPAEALRTKLLDTYPALALANREAESWPV